MNIIHIMIMKAWLGETTLFEDMSSNNGQSVCHKPKKRECSYVVCVRLLFFVSSFQSFPFAVLVR